MVSPQAWYVFQVSQQFCLVLPEMKVSPSESVSAETEAYATHVCSEVLHLPGRMFSVLERIMLGEVPQESQIVYIEPS